METFLDKIRLEKLDEVARNQEGESEAALWEKVKELPPAIPFNQAVSRKPGTPLSIIGEVKAKAPNRENVKVLDPVQIANAYNEAEIQAISVLTDEKYFGGSLDTLEEIRTLTDRPILQKEFIVSPYQLLQGRLRGASAALILVYYFNGKELHSMLDSAKAIGIETVVECSLPEELPRALEANPDILMINNRAIAAIPRNPNGTYHKGSVEVSANWWNSYEDLREWKKQDGKVLISASCISTPQDVETLLHLPFDAMLIGNAAMAAQDKVAFLNSMKVAP